MDWSTMNINNNNESILDIIFLKLWQSTTMVYKVVVVDASSVDASASASLVVASVASLELHFWMRFFLPSSNDKPRLS
jgi:hypothetical protein